MDNPKKYQRYLSLSRLAFYLYIFLTSTLAAQNHQTMTVIPNSGLWSERMALSDIKRNPQAWKIDFRKTPKWGYTHGLMLSALERLYLSTNKPIYLNYSKAFGNKMVNEQGKMLTYELDKFNIDKVNLGNVMFFLLEKTGDNKYRQVIETLYQQLSLQPRTKSGGFWHKKRYPNQMWLDGLYMGAPFYAQYLQRYNRQNSDFDDVQHQFDLVMQHHRDNKTGLLYHGWDESKQQKWADPKTGLSPHFWSRAMGWFVMALVDSIEYFPKDHPGKIQLQHHLKSVIDALVQVQDEKTGLWYQVLDKKGHRGNYLEATGSAMFVYTIAKAVNRHYLPKSYLRYANKGYNGIIKHLIIVDTDDNEVHLTRNCAVAGLGGKPYRDGSYQYYINEPIRDNDPKGIAPFIMASLELNR